MFLSIVEAETPNECPVTHPYAFKQGRNCCKTEKEDNHFGNTNSEYPCPSSTSFFRHPHCDTTCDGGVLSVYSNCCENGAFVRCDDGKFCTNGNENGGNKLYNSVTPNWKPYFKNVPAFLKFSETR